MQNTQLAPSKFEQDYQAARARCECAEGLPTLEEVRNVLREHLGEGLEEEGREELHAFADFEAFYDWWDTMTTYDQWDDGESAADTKPCLEVAYRSLLDSYTD